MKIMKIFTFISLNVICLFSLVSAQTVIQQLETNSSVDWQKFVVRSSGNSSILNEKRTASQRIQALEKARLSAEENLLKAIKALTLNADTKINDAIINKDLSLTYIESLVRQFTIVDTRSMSDMSVEIDIELPLTRGLFSIIMPKDAGTAQLHLSAQLVCPCCWQPWPEAKQVPAEIKLIIPADGFTLGDGKPYSGLIIDARELNLNPAILPRVLNEDSEEIFSVNYVNRDIAIPSGIVAYREEMSDAAKDTRVGPNPLQIRGLQATGKLKSNIVISNNDAIIIHAAAKSNNFLYECKVIIVIG